MNATPPSFHGAYIMQIPFLSTAHIPESDRARLRDPDNHQILAEITGGHGHILHIEAECIADDFNDYSPEFRSLLHRLTAAGFCYIRLDADGDVLPTLPTFD